MNVMKTIRIEKITLNMGTGSPGDPLEKAKKLLTAITSKTPVVTKTKKRIPTWGLRPGLEIGCKVTLRGKHAEETLKRLLQAVKKNISLSCFDKFGSLSFGVKEYLTIPDVEYDPTIGIIGLEVAVTLERPGYRIKRRLYKRTPISPRHQITKEDAIDFMKTTYGVTVS